MLLKFKVSNKKITYFAKGFNLNENVGSEVSFV